MPRIYHVLMAPVAPVPEAGKKVRVECGLSVEGVEVVESKPKGCAYCDGCHSILRDEIPPRGFRVFLIGVDAPETVKSAMERFGFRVPGGINVPGIGNIPIEVRTVREPAKASGSPNDPDGEPTETPILRFPTRPPPPADDES